MLLIANSKLQNEIERLEGELSVEEARANRLHKFKNRRDKQIEQLEAENKFKDKEIKMFNQLIVDTCNLFTVRINNLREELIDIRDKAEEALKGDK